VSRRKPGKRKWKGGRQRQRLCGESEKLRRDFEFYLGTNGSPLF
jgi:hypothetical protein